MIKMMHKIFDGMGKNDTDISQKKIWIIKL